VLVYKDLIIHWRAISPNTQTMNEKLLIAILATFVCAGCASTPATESQTAVEPAVEKSSGTVDSETVVSDVVARTESTEDSDDRVICRTITPTGSHRKKTICRTVSDIKQDREAAQDAVRHKQGPAITGAGD